jgi:hypothetical protein
MGRHGRRHLYRIIKSHHLFQAKDSGRAADLSLGGCRRLGVGRDFPGRANAFRDNLLSGTTPRRLPDDVICQILDDGKEPAVDRSQQAF